MKRTKSRKPALKVHATPPTEESTADLVPELGPPMTSTLAPLTPDAATLTKAAQEIVDRKLAEAKAIFSPGTSAPEPRRVGPLSKLERALVEQAADAQAPLVQEHERLAKRMAEVRVALARRDRAVAQAILEGRGEALAVEGEATRLVEDGGEVFVEVARGVKSAGRPA